MKTTKDGVQVPDRCWYYLLDFNDHDNRETLREKFHKNRLLDLTADEFWQLFVYVSKNDIKISNYRY